ncbi:MAG: hypothetical protein BWY59_01781 [Verrucomicrobia bacterium ADurb.Bin345]|nr:MAG: hypothetical protein BWY59_01781 [Verrucomicrobia bacterium ADurb.Bin345]
MPFARTTSPELKKKACAAWFQLQPLQLPFRRSELTPENARALVTVAFRSSVPMNQPVVSPASKPPFSAVTGFFCARTSSKYTSALAAPFVTSPHTKQRNTKNPSFVTDVVNSSVVHPTVLVVAW